MITFDEKVEQSRETLRMIAREYDNPIINAGFGKDSICLVHLANRDMKLGWPVMFHRDPYFPEKYRFANEIIRKWNIVAWDYPPRNTSVFYRNGVFEVARHYGIGYGDLALCAQLYTPDRFVEGEYLCALRDVYQQPLGTFDYRWDVCLSGHRFVETKPHSGHKQAGIKWAHKHNIGSCDVSYPLRDWSNQDVFAYHVMNGIPINSDVYDEVGGELVPKNDNRFNPDRRPACFECMKRDNPKMVLCPKRMCLVNNVSAGLRYMAFPPDHAWGRGEDGI
jgi:hypothetical protein